MNRKGKYGWLRQHLRTPAQLDGIRARVAAQMLAHAVSGCVVCTRPGSRRGRVTDPSVYCIVVCASCWRHVPHRSWRTPAASVLRAVLEAELAMETRRLGNEALRAIAEAARRG